MFESVESDFVKGKLINCVVISDVVSKCGLDTGISQNVP